MSEKKFVVNPGDEIIIRLPGKSKSLDAPVTGARRKAMMPVHLFDDFAPRRFKQGDTDGGGEPTVVLPPVFFFKFFQESGIFHLPVLNPVDGGPPIPAHTDY